MVVVAATNVTTIVCCNDRMGLGVQIWRYGDMEILEVRVGDDSGGSDKGDNSRVWQRLE